MNIKDIAMMFSTIKQRSQEERAKTRLERKFEKNSSLFTGCSTADGDADYALCTVEIFLVSSLCILFLQQFWEFIALGRRHFLELESWFKMLIFSLVLTSMFFLGNPDVMCNAFSTFISIYLNFLLQVLNVVASAAICLAWIEIIFMVGRYPFLGGKYVHTKHMMQQFQALSIFTIGRTTNS